MNKKHLALSSRIRDDNIKSEMEDFLRFLNMQR